MCRTDKISGNSKLCSVDMTFIHFSVTKDLHILTSVGVRNGFQGSWLFFFNFTLT